MDIEKLKKVNSLATSLRRQGIAVGRDDAARLAGEMHFGGQDADFGRIMDINMPKEETRLVQDAPMQMVQPVMQKTMDEKKFMDIMQKFADQFASEINSLTQKFEMQERAIVHMQGLLKNRPEQKPERIEKQEKIQEAVREEPKQSPRSGNYASNDVSIEKFFYFGKK